MVLDTLARCHRYTPLHPAFAGAFAFLNGPQWAALASGAAGVERHDIDGDRLYVSIARTDGRGHDGSKSPRCRLVDRVMKHCRCAEDQHLDDGGAIGIEDGAESAVITGGDGPAQRFALGGFFADPLINEHVRVY